MPVFPLAMAWVLVPLVALAACQDLVREPLMLPEHAEHAQHSEHAEHAEHEAHHGASKQHQREAQPSKADSSWWHHFWPFSLEAEADRHGDHHVHHTSHPSHAPSGHWWDHLWPFELEEKNEEDHRHGKHENHKSDAAKGDSQPAHWWDRLWPFRPSNAIELMSDEHSHEVKGHNSKDGANSHWWNRMWPFVLLSAALPAAALYVMVTRVQSSMQQPLLEEAAEA